jgi:predicted permease
MSSFVAELRTAARSLARNPVMTGSAVVCLALGIGGTTAVASAISRVFFEPLPMRDADRLVAVHLTTPETGPLGTYPQSAANFADLARESRAVRSLSAIAYGTALVDLGAETVEALRHYGTGDLFSALGTRPQLGRLFGPADDRSDAPPVAVLSNEFWRDKFHAEPSIVGRTVNLDGRPTTIIGVLPPRFVIPHGGDLLRADVWMPMRMTPQKLTDRYEDYLFVLGRLTNGATPASAQAELRTLFARLVVQYPALKGEDIRVAPLVAETMDVVHKPLLLLFGAVSMVLLIAATNVAALLLARGVQRQREMAVRTALGAARWDVIRPAITESLLLGALGAGLGLVLAAVGVRSIGALGAVLIPALAGLGIDWRVIAFGIATALIVSLACGAAPAWRLASIDPQETLRGGRGGGTRREQHLGLRALTVFEIALSLVLLVGAGLTLRAAAALLDKKPGFETAHVLTLDVTIAHARYPDATAPRQFLDPVVAAVQQIPGVVAAGFIQNLPYQSWGARDVVRYEGTAIDDRAHQPDVEQREVTPGFFAATGQRLLEGRVLTPNDDDGKESPLVVVVNAALAKRDFHGRSAVGRRFYYDSVMATIVGVVSDIQNVNPRNDPLPEMYYAYQQTSTGETRFPLLIRTRGNPMDVAGPVRQAIRGIDATAAVSNIATMQEVIWQSVVRARFYVTMLGAFAAIALALAIAGLYGILSYIVAQRARELGIRVALGSPPAALVRFVTREGMILVGIGLVVGFAASTALTRVMASMLFGLSPMDSEAWALGAVCLIVPTLVATVVPALRASRADPTAAMRLE